MPLPHPSSAMETGCNVHKADGPGGVGSRFIAPGEQATSAIANRPHWALAENDDYLGGIVDADLAISEVGALTFVGATGSIGIDPSGGAGGDINYSGSLYLGGGGWANNQESRDTLFQLLDENYNEVMVDGEEVKITATSQPVGSGFYSAGTVTLTLGTASGAVNIPAGNYRLVYAKGSSLAALPEDALIKVDIRGAQEAAGEVTRKSFYVAGPAGSGADFQGATAVGDAITALTDDFTLFIRNGTYTPSGAIAGDNIHLIGESRDGVILQPGIGNDITFSGSGVVIECLTVEVDPDVTKYFILGGDNVHLKDVTVDGKLLISGVAGGKIENVMVGGTANGGLRVASSSSLSFSGVTGLKATGSSLTYAALSLETVNYTSFDGCNFEAEGTSGQIALNIDGANYVTFSGCQFNSLDTGSLSAIYINSSDFTFVTFVSCQITGYGKIIEGEVQGSLRMMGCWLRQRDPSAAVLDTVFEFKVANNFEYDEPGIILDNVDFDIGRWDGGLGLWFTGDPCIYMEGVQGRNIRIDFSGNSQDHPTRGAALLTAYTKLEGVKIKLKGPDTTAANDRAVRVWYGSRIKDLKIEGLTGDWRTGSFSPLWVEGNGEGSNRAEVDGLELVGSSSWVAYDTTSQIEINDYGTVRRLKWVNVEWNYGVTGAFTAAVGLGSATLNPARSAHLLDSYFELSGDEAKMTYLIRSSRDCRNLKINGNEIRITAPSPTPMLRVVNLDADNVPSWPDPDISHGNLFGEFMNNTIFLDVSAGDMNDVQGYVRLRDGCYFWKVCFNNMYITGAVVDASAYWIEFEQADIGDTLALYTNGSGGCVAFGNVFWKVTDSDPGWSPLVYAGGANPPAGARDGIEHNVAVDNQ